MRIIQIIDSLEAGGAERMAVNYANALTTEISFSGLVATRKEGSLKRQLKDEVSYLFLDKQRALDFRALFRLRNYVIQHKVTIIHAHSTSFFLVFLLKLLCPSVRLIWHDHYGDSEFLSKRPIRALQLTLPLFSGIISVNQKLKLWAEEQLKFKKVLFLPNFPSEDLVVIQQTVLQGVDGKRIVCLANLRVQKDHFLLLEVAKKLQKSHPDWTFHLVGKDFQDGYSQQIKDLIVAHHLEKNVFLYGSKDDVENILHQSTLAVLTSQSEGLPVALLEYGWNRKAVVVTHVGEIASLVQNGKNGFVVPSKEKQLFYDAIVTLIENELLQKEFGLALYAKIQATNSEGVIIKEYLNWLQNSHK